MGSTPTPETASDSLRVELAFWGSCGHGELVTRSLLLPAGMTVEGLLEHLSTVLGSDLRAETKTGGTTFVVINGTYCVMPRDLARKLEDGDAVTLLPLVAGG